MAGVVVDDLERVVPVAGIDVLAPHRAGLDEVLVGIDHGHGIPQTPRRVDPVPNATTVTSPTEEVETLTEVSRRHGTEPGAMFEKCVTQSVTGFAIAGAVAGHHQGFRQRSRTDGP